MAAVWTIKVFGICSISRSCHNTLKLEKTPLPNPLGLLHAGNAAAGGSALCRSLVRSVAVVLVVVGQTHMDIHRVWFRCVWQPGVLFSHRGQTPPAVSAHRALSLSFAARDGAVAPLLPCTVHTWAPLISQCCSAVQCTLQPFLATA